MKRLSPDWRALWQEEYRHLGWVSVLCFIGGILACFNRFVPSAIGVGSVGVLVTLVGLIGWRRWYISRYLVFFFLFGAIGYGAASFRGRVVTAPVLERPVSHVLVSGVVVESGLLMGRQQVVLSDVRFLNEATIMPPIRVKLRYNSEKPVLQVGSSVVVRAFLRPPGKPVIPGGYHEGRVLWFQQIGAVGQIDEVVSVQSTSEVSVIKRQLERIRAVISHRVRSVLPDEEARITIPLIIGEQGVVSTRLYDLFRSAGITHVLSVSGFHLSLLAAFVFLLVRGVLSLFPVLVERVPPKKIAAVVALLVAIGYIGISGLQIPAIRSLLMIAIVLIAVLFDRNALSVQSVSIAAVIILLIRPEMVLNIGFQLSFLAVLILVTLYQPIYRFIFVRRRMSVIRRALAFIGGFMIVDVLVSLATTPFIIYHFQTYALYSGIGNLLTGALFSFWIMPLLLFAVLFMPFGWDVLFFKMAGWGLSYVIAVCSAIQDWPRAITVFPGYPTTALLVIGVGIVMLCVMRTRLRLCGVIVMGIGIGMAVIAPRPDMLVGDGGRTIAVREGDGRLDFIRKGKSDFVARVWRTHNGEAGEARAESQPKDFVWVKEKKIALTEKACRGADLCFLPDVPTGAEEHILPLYQWETRAVYIQPDGIRVLTVGTNEEQPWYMR